MSLRECVLKYAVPFKDILLSSVGGHAVCANLINEISVALDTRRNKKDQVLINRGAILDSLRHAVGCSISRAEGSHIHKCLGASLEELRHRICHISREWVLEPLKSHEDKCGGSAMLMPHKKIGCKFTTGKDTQGKLACMHVP